MSQNGITPRQARALRILAVTGSRTAAAEAAGVSRRTVYRWLQKPAVAEALRAAVAEALDDLSLSMIGLGKTAVLTLEAGMVAGDDETSWGVRVRAADVSLRSLLAVRELAALEARIAALEAHLTSEPTA